MFYSKRIASNSHKQNVQIDSGTSFKGAELILMRMKSALRRSGSVDLALTPVEEEEDGKRHGERLLVLCLDLFFFDRTRSS